MAGIYLHIPFCKTRCIYCDFYSTTRSELKTRYVRALCRELAMRKDYLKGEDIETVYFGGGTPSQLEKEDFEQIFDTIRTHYGLSHCQEITLEANPDDLTSEYLKMLSSLPFNRISMGIQTFDDPTLKLLKRRHNAHTAIEAVHR
ncbi:radical SAM protein, partial [Escherichia coli]|nr:radical SAM protein [Escherichia coli]